MSEINYKGIKLPDGNSYQTAGEYVPYSSTVSTPISDASVQNLAPEYDPTSTYSVKDWCVYNGVLYQCNTAIATPEAFDATNWTAKKIVDMTGSDIPVSDTDATTIAGALSKFGFGNIKSQTFTGLTVSANAVDTRDLTLTVSADYGILCGFSLAGTSNCSILQCYFTSKKILHTRVLNHASSQDSYSIVVFYI
jgi:hypothetical protein